MPNLEPIENDEKLIVLAEHYKTSVDTIKQDIKSRDKYFFVFIIFILILFVKVADYNLFEFIIIKVLDIKDTSIPSHNFSSLALWFLSLLCFIKYTQFHSSIERGYKYVKELEGELNANYHGHIFKKESDFYKKKQSHISKTNKIIIKYITPLFFTLVILNNLLIIFNSDTSIENTFESIICLILLHHIIFFAKES